jgi:16S rRNA (guanine966-N2)-methyltransferase
VRGERSLTQNRSMNHKAPNQVRIIGGLWRSRVIEFPDSVGLRPTPDRVRETLFNWLGQHLDGETCLDLFAGSGALGFEALSRGASEVVMVEQSASAARGLTENAQRLEADNATIVNTNAMQYLRGATRRFDVIFLDPPFNQGLLEQVLSLLTPWLAIDGKVYIESELTFAPGPAWKILKQSRAGQVKFQLMTPASVEET